MKKLLFAILAFGLITFTASAQRFGTGGRYQDNTGRNITYKTVAATSIDSITPNASYSYYTFPAMTAADTLTIRTTLAQKWDVCTVKFTSDTASAGHALYFQPTTGGSTVVWTTVSGSNITAKISKSVFVVFLFDGTLWAEISRSIQY